MKKLNGIVHSVYTNSDNNLGKIETDSIEVMLDGIVDDPHRGYTRETWVGDKQPQGTVRRNERQWSAVSIEEINKIVGKSLITKDIDEEIQREFKTAFDINYDILIEAAAERQKWIDMGQSLNLYNKYDSLKHMNDIYMYAWEKGLKTTYYLRGKAATRLEKSTVDSTPNACSILDPDCESCQ